MTPIWFIMRDELELRNFLSDIDFASVRLRSVLV